MSVYNLPSGIYETYAHKKGNTVEIYVIQDFNIYKYDITIKGFKEAPHIPKNSYLQPFKVISIFDGDILDFRHDI